MTHTGPFHTTFGAAALLGLLPLAIGIAAEWPVVRAILRRRRWARSLTPTITINLASAIAMGGLMPLLAGLWHDLPAILLDDWLHRLYARHRLAPFEAATLIAAFVALSTLIEAALLRAAWKARLSPRNLALLAAANAASYAAAVWCLTR